MNDRFVNPYTFVSLGSGKSKCRVSPSDKKLTGRIECRLITKTQIAVPDIAFGTDSHGINKHPFFRVDGKAVIPGSGIRGVVRNVYEALTDSCMHINDKDDDFFSSRQKKDKAGLLAFENREYVLYKAERFRARRSDNKKLDSFKTGDMVSCELYDSEDKSVYGTAENIRLADGGSYTGFFLRVNTFRAGRAENHPSVFEESEEIVFHSSELKDSAGVKIGGKTISAFEENIKRYAKHTGAVGEEYLKCFNNMSDSKTLLPVWYYTKNGNYYLSPSQMSRTVFICKPNDMLERMGYSSCKTKDEMCEACALFGMIGNDALSGRVRFSDAVCGKKNIFDKFYVLPVLGSPKLSSFEFYLKRKDGVYREDKGTVAPYDPDDQNVILAGRKFYWHNNGKKIERDDEKAVEIALKKSGDNNAAKDNCIELVKKGAEFAFTVYFDGITEEQLKMLVFSLDFGENSEYSALCHKIGHGKPVGLGSAKIVADKVVVRDISDGKYTVQDVSERFLSPDGKELFKESLLAQVLKAVNMDTIPNGSMISYPRTETSPDAFSWFADNRETMRSTGMPRFFNRLPDITDKDQSLPMAANPKKKNGNSVSYNKGRR